VTVTVTDHIDRINARAAQVDWRQVALVALMVIPFAAFYGARLLVRVAAWAGAWLWAAGMEGWDAAGPDRRGSG